MNYKIIATGSAGNAVIINDNILIDCGVPYKSLRPYDKQLRLVLLTHEHSDHFRPGTIRILARQHPAIRWACCEWMVGHLLAAGVPARAIDVFEPHHAGSYDGLAAIMPEQLTHNVPNCGWHVFQTGESLFYATDTGTLDGIEASNYDLYMIEANHTQEELAARIAAKEARGEFAYEYRAAENHLSYEQAVDWLASNMGPHSQWIPMHAHIDHGGEENAEQDSEGEHLPQR